MVARVSPLRISEEEETRSKNEETNESSSSVSIRMQQKSSTSIKCCMIFMISGMLLMSVIVLSAIWLSSFSPSIIELSSLVRVEQFSTIIKYSQVLLIEVSILTESIKRRLAADEYVYQANDYIERAMFAGKRSAILDKIIISSYVGDTDNNCIGAMELISGGQMNIVNTSSINQLVYYCQNYTEHDRCIRNKEPDEIIPTFDFYADISMPNYVFITSISCIVVQNVPLPKNHNFHYYVGNDMTVESISKFLKEKTDSITGSTSFIVETETEFLLAVDNVNISLSEWKSDGSLDRKTPGTVQDNDINSISQSVLGSYQKWNSILCNQMYVLSEKGQYISIYRLCTSSKIDWVIVLSVPQWNYLGSTIIAIICSLIGSIVIISVGLISGIFVSLKVVKPFYNLIELFESVSNMDLDQLQVYPSSFSEVKQLQGHFLSMVGKIKLYKSFIPAHLLSEIEGKEEEDPDRKKEYLPDKPSFRQDSNLQGLDLSQSSLSSFSGRGSKSHFSSQKKIDYSGRSRHKFSLYLEEKQVTFVHIQFQGLGIWLQQMHPNSVIEILSDAFLEINNVSKTMSGYVGAFENGSITVSFNASNNQINHEEKGVMAASSLLKKLSAVKLTKWKSNQHFKKESLLDIFSFKISVATQTSYCGNAGTNEIKSFTIMSRAKQNLEIFSQVAFQLEINIVVSQSIKEKCEKLFQFRYVDTKEVYEDGNMDFTANETIRNPTNLYEMGASLKVNDDEVSLLLSSIF